MVESALYALFGKRPYEVCKLIVVRKVRYEERYDITVVFHTLRIRGRTGEVAFEDSEISLTYLNLTQKLVECFWKEVTHPLIGIREIYELTIGDRKQMIRYAPYPWPYRRGIKYRREECQR